jgi:hypothetical protein
MSTWAATELQTTDVGDMRRNRRLVNLVEDLAALLGLSAYSVSLRGSMTMRVTIFPSFIPVYHEL